MDSLILPSTFDTPQVAFHPEGSLTISGRAMSAKAWSFFGPLFEWLDEYRKNPPPSTTLNLEFDILHVDSLVKILDICKSLSVLTKKGCNVTINWYFEKDDEDMRETASMFSEILKSVRINEIVIENDKAH